MTELLSQTIIDNWRAAALKNPPSNGRNFTLPPKAEGAIRIAAVMSCPRVSWTDTWGCVNEVFMPLGIGVVKHSGVFWGQGLTELLEEAVKHDFDFAITVDYDSIFTRSDVLKLVELITENPDVDAIVPVQIRRENNTSMFTIRGEDGELLKEVKGDVFMKPLTDIATGHFGLTIIRLKSLAKLIKPWFVAIPDGEGGWGPGHIDEDIYFWLNAEVSRWRVCLANEVRIGHLQNVVTWPRPDFKPYFQYMKDFYRGKGQEALHG